MFGSGSDLGSWAIAAAVGILSAGASVAVTIAVLVRLPADHFACDHRSSQSVLARVGRNVAGVLLIALGIMLSFPGVPGQGLLTILLGVMCLDVPGKRRLELWILRRPSVERGVAKVRARYGKPPLELPGGCEPGASTAMGAGSTGPGSTGPASTGAGSTEGGSTGGGSAGVETTAGEVAEGEGAAAASRFDKTR